MTQTKNIVSTLCVGLTPAVQELREFNKFKLGAVNRPDAVHVSAAGKGVNVAHVICTLGGQAQLIGFIGGYTGDIVIGELDRWKVRHDLTRVKHRTRSCTTLLDRSNGEVTELVEEGSLPVRSEWAAFQKKFAHYLPRANLLALAGKLMPGAPVNTYRDFVKQATAHGVPVLIDSQGDPFVRTLPHKPYLAKLNVHELENTVGKLLPTSRAIESAARSLMKQGAQNVMVTDGAKSAWLIEPDTAWRLTPPKVKALNPIGSGDAVTSGIAYALMRGEKLIDAVHLGIACGTANALTLMAGTVHPRDVSALTRKVNCRVV